MITKFKRRIIRLFRRHSLPRWLVFFIDVAAVFLTFLFAYLLRFNLEMSAVKFDMAIYQSLIVTGTYILFMLLFKPYSGLIRHTAIRDAFNLFLTATTSVILIAFLIILERWVGFAPVLRIPISILVIHYVIVLTGLFFFRLFIKMFYEFASSLTRQKKNVIIYGAGEMGLAVKSVIEADARSGYRIAVIMDDNWRKQGKKIEGINVYSQAILNEEFISGHGISVFIFAINNLPPKRKKEVLERVIALGLESLETPSFESWMNGTIQVKQLRRVKLEDLLGREPIQLNQERIAQGLKGKVILVTGAAGSIGSEIVRQLMKYECGRLLLLDQAETPAFYLQNELSQCMKGLNCELIIGDVTNLSVMEHIFSSYSPDIVFHAAAYKHVPIMEGHPHEAFRVNVGGTKIITDLSIKYGVEKFVMVSTDKAVNPINVMGATKRVCELYVQAQSLKPDMKTQFVTTRFGNVLGSNGSVVPLFTRQISEGGPVTITDPGIKRFFMTIPEACQLVLEAGFMGRGGEIYVFDMGEPVKILDLANNLIRLSGLEPGEDIKIEFTGLRPGEKLYEELFAAGEPLMPTHHPKINIARTNGGDMGVVLSETDRLLEDLYSLSDESIVEGMMKIVPEYRPKTK